MVDSVNTSGVSTSSDSTSSVSRGTRRYWKQLDEPRGSWWPWGWLPLLGLLLALLYGLFVTAPDMEEDVQAQVTQALHAANFKGFTVEADGQSVSVSGTGADSIKPQLLGIARGAACDSWIAKDLTCPTHVTVNLTAPKAPPRAAAVVQPTVELEPEPVVRLHDFKIEKNETALRLIGEVPSISFKSDLVARARAAYPNVVDQLRVSNEQAGPNIDWAAKHAMSVLALLNSGGASWKGGQFSAWGVVSPEGEERVRSLFNATGKGSMLGDLRLQLTRTADVCDEQFANALADATIQFRTSSAEISAQSQPLLETLADLARQCPVQLAVEGHTDSRGSREMNQQLSLARAQAVVNALGSLGVNTDRLKANGFGPDRPIADNQTSIGRAKNRRIEIKSIAAD